MRKLGTRILAVLLCVFTLILVAGCKGDSKPVIKSTVEKLPGQSVKVDCVKYFSQIRFPLGSRQLPGQRMRLCIYFQ